MGGIAALLAWNYLLAWVTAHTHSHTCTHTDTHTSLCPCGTSLFTALYFFVGSEARAQRIVKDLDSSAKGETKGRGGGREREK